MEERRIPGLLQRLHDGDEEAGFELVTLMEPLVSGMARRFAAGPVEADDYYQVGMIGLLKAARRYNTEFKVKFTTYAIRWIRGEMQLYRRNCQAPVKVSRSLREQSLALGFYREHLMQKLQREPTVSELAGEMGVSAEDLVMAMESNMPLSTLEEEDGSIADNGFTLEDRLVDRLSLYEGIMKLAPMERQIIILRFFMEQTQSEIASTLTLSQRQISRLERRILSRLKSFIQP